MQTVKTSGTMEWGWSAIVHRIYEQKIIKIGRAGIGLLEFAQNKMIIINLSY